MWSCSVSWGCRGRAPCRGNGGVPRKPFLIYFKEVITTKESPSLRVLARRDGLKSAYQTSLPRTTRQFHVDRARSRRFPPSLKILAMALVGRKSAASLALVF